MKTKKQMNSIIIFSTMLFSFNIFAETYTSANDPRRLAAIQKIRDRNECNQAPKEMKPGSGVLTMKPKCQAVVDKANADAKTALDRCKFNRELNKCAEYEASHPKEKSRVAQCIPETMEYESSKGGGATDTIGFFANCGVNLAKDSVHELSVLGSAIASGEIFKSLGSLSPSGIKERIDKKRQELGDQLDCYSPRGQEEMWCEYWGTVLQVAVVPAPTKIAGATLKTAASLPKAVRALKAGMSGVGEAEKVVSEAAHHGGAMAKTIHYAQHVGEEATNQGLVHTATAAEALVEKAGHEAEDGAPTEGKKGH